MVSATFSPAASMGNGWLADAGLGRDPCAVGRSEQAKFVFEMADWALDWQHERTGAFLCDLSATKSFHTGFIAEGIAAAWELALRVGDMAHADRYRRSCQEALRFMTSLIVYPEDTYCMRDPEQAVGGVRSTLVTSDIRIDYVSHTLLAFARTLLLSRPGTAE